MSEVMVLALLPLDAALTLAALGILAAGLGWYVVQAKKQTNSLQLQLAFAMTLIGAVQSANILYWDSRNDIPKFFENAITLSISILILGVLYLFLKKISRAANTPK
jgi:hypothetical protein